MKILMTGMASAHCSDKGNMTFFRGLLKAFSEFAEVTICEPNLSWTRSDLESYDLVVVGLTPPTALSANKIYGALHILNLLYESPKLRVVVDGPQIWQFKNSFNSFIKNPLQIFGSMYSSRKDYSIARAKYADSFVNLADKLKSIPWPKTYVPLLPWRSVDQVSEATGIVPVSRAIGVNVDSFLIDRQSILIAAKNSLWAVDNYKSSWWGALAKTLRLPGTPVSEGKKPRDLEVDLSISKSIGLIVAPQDRKVGTWWSYRYIQGLNLNVPIVTYWQDTAGFSESWSQLAYQVEDMDQYDRQELARNQFRDYMDALPSTNEVVTMLRKDLLESIQERT
jgi:hypothetical protein